MLWYRHCMRHHKISTEMYALREFFDIVFKQTEESVSNNFVCKFGGTDLCNFETDTNTTMMEHLKMHLAKNPFKCAFCKCRFNSLALIRRHLRRNHRSRKITSCKKGLACPHSDCTFALTKLKLDKMLAHIKAKHHFTESIKSSPCSTSVFSINFAASKRVLIDESDGRKLRRKRRTTTEDSSMILCSFKGCTFKSHSKTQVKAHEYRRHSKKVFRCTQEGCAASQFGSKAELNRHLMEAHKISQFRCTIPECDKPFLNRWEYRYFNNSFNDSLSFFSTLVLDWRATWRRSTVTST